MSEMTHGQREAFDRGKADWRAGKRLALHNPYWRHEEGHFFWRQGWLEEDDFTIITTADGEDMLPSVG